jgi:hypothetical protein
VEQAVQHGGDRGAVAEQFAPVLYGAIGSEQGAGTLVTAHEDLQQLFRRRGPYLPHPQVIDDQKRHGGQQFHVLFAFSVQDAVGDFFQQNMGLAIDHSKACVITRSVPGTAHKRWPRGWMGKAWLVGGGARAGLLGLGRREAQRRPLAPFGRNGVPDPAGGYRREPIRGSLVVDLAQERLFPRQGR